MYNLNFVSEGSVMQFTLKLIDISYCDHADWANCPQYSILPWQN